MPNKAGTPMTISDCTALDEVLQAAQQSAKVAWANEDGDVFYGTARHIVKSPDNYGFLGHGEDVRNGYLRITTQSGMETALAVSELMELVPRGGFARYDW